MIQEVLIKVVGETKGIKDTLAQLEKVKQIDKETAESFKVTTQQFKHASNLRQQAIQNEIEKLNSLKMQSKLAFTPDNIAHYNNKISETQRNIDLLKGKHTELGSSAGFLNEKFKQIGSTIVAAFATQQIISFGKEAFHAYEEQEKSARRLLNAVGGNVEMQKRLLEVSSKMQGKYAIKNEDIESVMQYFAIQGQSEAQIKKSTQAAIQYSKVLNVDLAAAQMVIGGTFEGVIGKMGRLDDRFNKFTKTQLENGAAVDLINKKYAGVAEASVTFADRMAVAWDTTLETVGAVINDIVEGLGIFETADQAFIKENSKVIESNKASAQYGQALLDKYIAISNNGLIPAAEKSKLLKDVTNDLIVEFGDSVVEIDKQTGAYKLNTKAVQENIDAKLAASDAAFQELLKKGVEEDQVLNLKYMKRRQKEDQISGESGRLYAKEMAAYNEYVNKMSQRGAFNLPSFDKWLSGYSKLTTAQQNQVKNVQKVKAEIYELDGAIDELEGSVADYRDELIKLGYSETEIAKEGWKVYKALAKSQSEKNTPEIDQAAIDKENAARAAAYKKWQETQIAMFDLEQKIALERYKLMEDDEYKRQLFALKQEELLNEKKLQILGAAYHKEYELEKLVVANKLQEFGISYEKYLKDQNDKEAKSHEEALKEWERIEKEKIKIREGLQKLDQDKQKLMFTKQQAFEYAEFMKGNPTKEKIAAFEEAQAADKMQFELEQLKTQYTNLNKEDVNYAQNKIALEQQIADKEAEIQRQSIANQARADEEANRKKEERAKERLEFTKQIEEAYFEQLDKQHEYNMKMLDREIDKQRSNIEIQQDLANRGLENTLSFEKAKAEALEKQKLDAERKEKKRQEKKEAAELVLAFYSAYQENVKSGEKPTQALANAFKSTLLAKMLGKTIAMMEDGGIIGVDGKPLTNNIGVVQGALHSQGGVTVNMEGGEGLLSRKEMANMGAANFYNLKRMLKTNRLPVDGGKNNNTELLTGINKLNETFERIPQINWGVDNLHNIVRTEIRSGLRTETTYKRRSVNA